MIIDHNYENKRAALGIMGWDWDEQGEAPFIESQTHYSWVTNWNPCTDRNHAYEVLKRAEELGMIQFVISKIGDTFNRIDPYGCPSLWLTCPPDIITKAVNDVFEESTKSLLTDKGTF